MDGIQSGPEGDPQEAQNVGDKSRKLLFYTILTITAIILTMAVLLLIFGAKFVYELSDYFQETPLYNYFIALAIVAVFLGAIIVLTSVFGSVAVLKNKPALLNSYTIILFLLFIFALVFAIVSTWEIDNRNALEVKVNSSISYLFRELKVTPTVDILQKQFECCGTYGPGYWNSSIPVSCCKVVDDCGTTLYQTGCQRKIYNHILNQIIRIIEGALATICPAQVVGAVLSQVLRRWRISRQPADRQKSGPSTARPQTSNYETLRIENKCCFCSTGSE